MRFSDPRMSITTNAQANKRGRNHSRPNLGVSSGLGLFNTASLGGYGCSSIDSKGKKIEFVPVTLLGFDYPIPMKLFSKKKIESMLAALA